MNQKIVLKENKEVVAGVFDKIMVVIKGKQLPSRPVDFVFGEDKLPQKAIKWETVNPDDGQMIQFSIDEVSWDNGVAYFGEKPSKIMKPDVIVVFTPKPRIHVSMLNSLGQVKPVHEMEIVEEVCPFKDPIEEGIFQIE